MLDKILLQNRLVGSDIRQLSTNSPAIRSQIPVNLASNIHFFATARQT
jgi:hypothetical protein